MRFIQLTLFVLLFSTVTQAQGLKMPVDSTKSIKTKIVDLAVIGTCMYVFKDQLTNFSIKHDKLAHLALSLFITEYFGPKFAIGFMLSIELTQVDIFGIKNRYKDTALDLTYDSIGIFISIKLWKGYYVKIRLHVQELHKQQTTNI